MVGTMVWLDHQVPILAVDIHVLLTCKTLSAVEENV